VIFDSLSAGNDGGGSAGFLKPAGATIPQSLQRTCAEESMIQITLDDEHLQVPNWVIDLEAFRRWSDDDAFPETGQISFLKGNVWVNMSKEQLFDHNLVKTEFIRILAGLVRALDAGRYFGDGAFLSNVNADVSNQPDGMFISTTTMQQGLIRAVEGKKHGHVELEGTPDMVLEVVSDSSVDKDTVVLRQAYAEAGIREYWLVDARQEPLRFDILRLTDRGYVATRKRSGWVRSEVFDRWFHLAQQPGSHGFPQFTLEVQTQRPG
jgi:Uma2 family endonuclease